MLKSVLKSEQCAKCKICCSFLKSDVWEAPDFTRNVLNEDSFKNDSEILLCPALDECKGCTMGKDKPFDCSIWPLRPFYIEGRVRIGVAEICPELGRDNDGKLIDLLENGLYDKILSAIKKDKSLVKNHPEGYRIIY